jgi:hypothetical protein
MGDAMGSWSVSQDRLRSLYPGGRADYRARRYARMCSPVFSLGLLPGRWVTLEVPGRTSGRAGHAI